VFVQSNATTSAGTFYTHGGDYRYKTIVTVAGGTLGCSNYTAADSGAQLNQSGGALVVSNLLDFGASGLGFEFFPIYGTYTFTGGTLTASNINISGILSIGDGTVKRISNPGFFSLSHLLQISNAVEQLGHFILLSNATIDLAGSASRLGFANSSSETWAGGATLGISNWNGNPSGGGAEQISFSSDNTGLTSQQLSQVQFIFPAGLPIGTYSARILPSGEVVPAQLIPSIVTFSQQGTNLVLTWPAGWTLQSATMVPGPYRDVINAISPYTTNMTARPDQFFRLRQ
jgi:hypothetical protein